ncbi:MAG: AMP-binding protein [Micromonosporaceae bacterium]|nr:AMP-binding protein [Micromonosporaceae bacterium]
MANLATNLSRSAAQHPDRPAIRLDDEVHRYRSLAAGAAAAVDWLRERGVRPGDRVALQLPNLPLFAVCYYGILAAGAVVVPLNPLFKPREVAYHLADSQATLLLAAPGVAEPATAGAGRAGVACQVLDPDTAARLAGTGAGRLDPAPRGPEDTAVILYTSGTTGVPKGAELTHANLSRNAEVVRDTLQHTGPEDVIFGGLPLYHSFGQTSALNTGVASGSCLTLLPRFEPGKALEILQRDRVTVFLGVPTMYAALLHHPAAAAADLSPLRLCVSGGASLPVELLHGFEDRFGCTILEGYGLSETSPVVTFNHPDRPRKPGSIGTPIDGVQARIVNPADPDHRDLPPGEVGEVWIRGHNVMKGYWRRPEATAEAVVDGWFRSGDLARADPEGYLFIVDRIKDLVIRGGYNVYPREVEEVLYEHPAVAEAAVIGIPHPTLGQEVGAAVALKPGATATADELRSFVKEQVAPQKYPRHVWLLEELPKGPTGKLLKREITPPASVTSG